MCCLILKFNAKLNKKNGFVSFLLRKKMIALGNVFTNKTLCSCNVFLAHFIVYQDKKKQSILSHLICRSEEEEAC